MIRRLGPAIVFLTLLAAHAFLLLGATRTWRALPKDESRGTVLPSAILKITSLEYDGPVSDYLFMEAMVYIGGKISKERTVHLTSDEWNRVYNLLDVSSDLDPLFIDPYYVGNAYLTWDARMVDKANRLLEKGIRARSWDWTLPFFAGFNQFFFLHDNVKASELLETAALRPGASPILASLASRLAYQENRIENSIAFLEEMVNMTGDEQLKEQYELRIEALRTRLFLEKIVAAYRKKYHRLPRELQDIRAAGMLSEIPADPLGGRFRITPDGRVESSSDEFLRPAANPFEAR